MGCMTTASSWSKTLPITPVLTFVVHPIPTSVLNGPKNPFQISIGPGADVQDNEFRRVIRVIGQYKLLEVGKNAAARFHQQQHLRTFLDLALPPIVRLDVSNKVCTRYHARFESKPCEVAGGLDVRRGNQDKHAFCRGFHDPILCIGTGPRATLTRHRDIAVSLQPLQLSPARKPHRLTISTRTKLHSGEISRHAYFPARRSRNQSRLTGNAPGLLHPRTFNRPVLGTMPCDSVARKSPLIPMVSQALPPMQWALVGAKRLEYRSLLPLCLYAQTTCLSPYGLSGCSGRWQPRSAWSAAACCRFVSMPKLRACPHMASADAVGVGSREAFGVRQLAAALSLRPNNVSVPISAPEWFLRRLRQPPIETRDNLRATPRSRSKTQTTSLSLYLRRLGYAWAAGAMY